MLQCQSDLAELKTTGSESSKKQKGALAQPLLAGKFKVVQGMAISDGNKHIEKEADAQMAKLKELTVPELPEPSAVFAWEVRRESFQLLCSLNA